MPLTEFECRRAKERGLVYVLSDGNGLMLEIRPSGRKYWISRLWIDRREKRRSLGPYPEVSLREAREKNRALRAASGPSGDDLFGAVAEEWYRKKADGTLAPSYVRVIRLRMDRYLKVLYQYRVREVSAAVILSLCRGIEEAGTVETAHRVRQLVGQILRFGVATGRVEIDPSPSLRGALTPAKESHYAAITTPEGIRDLVRAIDSYRPGVVRLALFFSLLTFARPGEIRRAEWAEIDSAAGEWRIPEEKTKMKRGHIVPLSRETLGILDELRPLTGHQKWLFPSARGDGRPMSENAVRIALRTIGYSNSEMTAHGFRSTASTILNESGLFPPDIIERQLAHIEKNPVRGAYNRAEYLPKRREMMEWWGRWIFALRAQQE